MAEFSKSKLTSIIIPVYNREALIRKTLSSLARLKYRPLEIVIVNDGSTDNSSSIIQKFKKSYETDNFLVKIISQSNSGAPVARNVGFAASNGYYIQFLDSDDSIHEDKIKLQTQLLEKNNADFCVCDFLMKWIDTNDTKFYSNKRGLLKIIFPSQSFGCGSTLITRSLAMKLDWDIKLHRNQDMDYFLRAALMANKVVHIKKILYYYNMHNQDRISDNYTSSIPVFDKRIKGLINTKTRIKNIPLKYIAILLLCMKGIKWYIGKYMKKVGKKHL